MPPAHSPTATAHSWLNAWRQQALNTPWLSAGLGLSLLAILILLAASLWNAVNGDHANNLHLALLGGLSGFGATALGAVLAVVMRDVSARSQDVMLGFAAGMMLAASSFSLILPGLDAAREITGNAARYSAADAFAALYRLKALQGTARRPPADGRVRRFRLSKASMHSNAVDIRDSTGQRLGR